MNYPSIDMIATGQNIKSLMKERGITVKDVQQYMGFEQPQAVYHWLGGSALPKVDNLYALSILLRVTVNDILVQTK